MFDFNAIIGEAITKAVQEAIEAKLADYIEREVKNAMDTYLMLEAKEHLTREQVERMIEQALGDLDIREEIRSALDGASVSIDI